MLTKLLTALYFYVDNSYNPMYPILAFEVQKGASPFTHWFYLSGGCPSVSDLSKSIRFRILHGREKKKKQKSKKQKEGLK